MAVARLSARRAGFPSARVHRVLLLAAALIGVLFLQKTAERGARLVYEYGVAVVAAPMESEWPPSISEAMRTQDAETQ